MVFSRRSISSAPVTTRRTSRTFSHFSAPAPSRQSAGSVGNSRRCTDGLARVRSSQALHGEDEDRREPGGEASNTLLEHGERRRGADRRDRVAVERVLADVEVEGREVDIHEVRQRRDDALVVVARRRPRARRHRASAAGAASAARARACRHRRQASSPRQCASVAEQPAHGVAQLAIGSTVGLMISLPMRWSSE
jgi:hypothetical protein